MDETYSNYSSPLSEVRPHQGIDGQIPAKKEIDHSCIIDLSMVKYKKTKHLHGLFTEFKIAA